MTSAPFIRQRRAGRPGPWLLGGALALLIAAPAAMAAGVAPARGAQGTALFTPRPASPEVTQVASWVLASGDNAGQAFVIVDKRDARVFAFAPDGTLQGATPALLGLARGDVNPPGIGDRPLSAIGPKDRITAAGRYVAMLGNDLGKADILWVDYAAGLSLHRVIPGKPSDQRRRRLETPGVDDNRISYGCINVPAAFFDDVVKPLFVARTGIVYVLPEVKRLQDVFPIPVLK